MKEVTRLLEMCESKRVQDILSQEQKKIEQELAEKQQQREQQAKRDSGDKADSTVKGYTVKISNYGECIVNTFHQSNAYVNQNDYCFIWFSSIIGWDQSDKFVKVYITLKGVHKIPSENVQVSFTDRYVKCSCTCHTLYLA